MTPCPSKRSHINAGKPPRFCYATCARYEYAVHLTNREWIKPAIRGGECVNHVQNGAPSWMGFVSPENKSVQTHSMEV